MTCQNCGHPKTQHSASGLCTDEECWPVGSDDVRDSRCQAYREPEPAEIVLFDDDMEDATPMTGEAAVQYRPMTDLPDEQHKDWCSAVGPDCRCLQIPDPSPTDLPDAETAWEKYVSEHVSGETVGVIAVREGITAHRDFFLAGFAAASGPWAEQLDAANAELRRDLNNEASALQEAEAERDAALARNAELEKQGTKLADGLHAWRDQALLAESRVTPTAPTTDAPEREVIDVGDEGRLAATSGTCPTCGTPSSCLDAVASGGASSAVLEGCHVGESPERGETKQSDPEKFDSERDALRAELDNLRNRVTALCDHAEKDGQGIYIDSGHTHVTAVETGLIRAAIEGQMSTSNTRRCTECHDPMTLGKRDCQTCGASSWEWIDPTMTDDRMKAQVRAAIVRGSDDE